MRMCESGPLLVALLYGEEKVRAVFHMYPSHAQVISNLDTQRAGRLQQLHIGLLTIS